MTEREGVIKYRLDYTAGDALYDLDYRTLTSWHRVFKQAGILGQDPKRYAGLGFGNLSQRLQGPQFLISGTQTGHLDALLPEHYAVVRQANIPDNRIVATGPVKPSSESLTHAAIYALHADIRFVFHGHSPDIWQARASLKMPETRASVPYGTPAMATEMKRLYETTGMTTTGIIAMAGHEDGIISFGPTAEAAGQLMLNFLGKAQDTLPS